MILSHYNLHLPPRCNAQAMFLILRGGQNPQNLRGRSPNPTKKGLRPVKNGAEAQALCPPLQWFQLNTCPRP